VHFGIHSVWLEKDKAASTKQIDKEIKEKKKKENEQPLMLSTGSPARREIPRTLA